MSYDTKTEKRWPLKTLRGPIELSVDYKISFITQMGEYDVHFDHENSCYTVVKERPTDSRAHNFTDYYLRDGTSASLDMDVPLDPYHMCLLYQLHEEVVHTLNIEDCEDN